MNRKYVVFWLPTIFHEELKPQEKEIPKDERDFIDVSDSSEYPYRIRLRLLEDESIEITSKVTGKNGKDEFITTLKLECERDQKRKSGFRQFSFCENDIPTEHIKSFKYNLTTSIYHKIKEFYHKHESHSKRDGNFRPEITDAKIDLTEDNNPAIVHFLQVYSKLFHRQAKGVSNLNAAVDRSMENYRKEMLQGNSVIGGNIDSYDRVRKDVDTLNKMLENSLIEYTYCKTLLSSIYNKLFKHDLLLDRNESYCFDTKNKFRRGALNIRNSVRYIENIRCKNQNRQYELLHISNILTREVAEHIQRQNKLSESLHKKGTMLAVCGILFALLFGFRVSLGIVGFNTLLIALSLFTGWSLFSNYPMQIFKRISFFSNPIIPK